VSLTHSDTVTVTRATNCVSRSLTHQYTCVTLSYNRISTVVKLMSSNSYSAATYWTLATDLKSTNFSEWCCKLATRAFALVLPTNSYWTYKLLSHCRETARRLA